MNLPLQMPTSLDLQQACRSYSLGELKACVSQKGGLALINQRDETIGWTPLYRSVLSGFNEGVEFLLENGADPNLQSKNGKTPLHLAAQNGDRWTIETLLKHESTNPNVQDCNGQTALHQAVDLCFPDCVKCLIEHGADATIVDVSGQTPEDIAQEQSPDLLGFIKTKEVRCKSVMPSIPMSTVNSRAPISFDEFLKHKGQRAVSGTATHKKSKTLLEIDNEFRTVLLAPEEFKNERGDLLSTIKNRQSSQITTPFASDIVTTESQGCSHEQTPEYEMTKQLISDDQRGSKELTFKNFQCLRDSKTRTPFQQSKILRSQDKENMPCNIAPAQSQISQFSINRKSVSQENNPSPRRQEICTESPKKEVCETERRSVLGERQVSALGDPIRISFGLEQPGAATARKCPRDNKSTALPPCSQSFVLQEGRRWQTRSPYHRPKPEKRLNLSISAKVKECEELQRHIQQLMTHSNKQTLDLLTGNTPRQFEGLNMSLNQEKQSSPLQDDQLPCAKVSTSFVDGRGAGKGKVTLPFLPSHKATSEISTERRQQNRPPLVSPSTRFAIIHGPEASTARDASLCAPDTSSVLKPEEQEKKVNNNTRVSDSSPSRIGNDSTKLPFAGHFRRVHSVSEPGSAGRINLSSTRYASSFCEEEEKGDLLEELCEVRQEDQPPNSARSISELLQDVQINEKEVSSPSKSIQTIKVPELSPIQKISAPDKLHSKMVKRGRTQRQNSMSFRENVSVVEVLDEQEAPELSKLLSGDCGKEFMVENFSFQESSFFDSFFLAPYEMGVLKYRLVRSVGGQPLEQPSLQTLSPNKMPDCDAILISQAASSSQYFSSPYVRQSLTDRHPLTETIQHESKSTGLIVALFRSSKNDIPSSVSEMKVISRRTSIASKPHSEPPPPPMPIEEAPATTERRPPPKKKRLPLIPRPRVKRSHRGFSSQHFKSFQTNPPSSSDDSDIYDRNPASPRQGFQGKKRAPSRASALQGTLLERSLSSFYKADVDDDCNISEDEEISLYPPVKRAKADPLNDTFVHRRDEAYLDSDHIRSSEEQYTFPIRDTSQQYQTLGVHTTQPEFSPERASTLSEFVIDSSEEKLPVEGRGLEQLYLTFQDQVKYEATEKRGTEFYTGGKENIPPQSSESLIPEEMNTSEDQEAKQRVADLRRAETAELERALNLDVYKSIESLEMTHGLPIQKKMEALPYLGDELQDREELKQSLGILQEWLDEIHLGFLAPVLLEGGFDDVQMLVKQMRTQLRISESMLRNIGIQKPGHRVRILVKLEEQANLLFGVPHQQSPSPSPSYTPFKDSMVHGRGLSMSIMSQSSWVPPRSASPFMFQPSASPIPPVATGGATSSFFQCCSRPSVSTAHLPSAQLSGDQIPTLKAWLRALKLGTLHGQFVMSGYDNLEALLKQMGSSFVMTDETLRRDIGVSKLGHRSRLLAKLH